MTFPVWCFVNCVTLTPTSPEEFRRFLCARVIFSLINMRQTTREDYATLYQDFQRAISASSANTYRDDLLLEFYGDGGIRNWFSKLLGRDKYELPGNFEEPEYREAYKSAVQFIVDLKSKGYKAAYISDFLTTLVKRTPAASDSGSESESRGDDQESARVQGADDDHSAGELLQGPRLGGYRRGRGSRGESGRDRGTDEDEGDEVQQLASRMNQTRLVGGLAKKIYSVFSERIPGLDPNKEDYSKKLGMTAIGFSNFLSQIPKKDCTDLMAALIKVMRGGTRSASPEKDGTASTPASAVGDAPKT